MVVGRSTEAAGEVLDGDLGAFGLRLPGPTGPLQVSFEVLDGAPMGMAITASNGAILWANAAFCSLVGHELGALLSEPFAGLIHEEDRDRLGVLEGEVLARTRPFLEVEERLRPVGGGEVWVLERTSRATSPKGHHLEADAADDPLLVRQVLDITDRRVTERALERARADLAVRNTELERSNAELSEFASVISHDLSEPLRVIAGHVALLERRLGDELDEDATSWIHHAVAGCTRMRQLIDDLLAYARIGQQDPPRAPVDLDELVSVARRDLATLLEESGASLTVGPLPRVEGDANLIGQVVRNLVVNAVKFSPPGRRPEIEVSSRRAGEATVEVRVADNGPGIPEQHRERAFRVFQRLHGRSIPGTGIGLAICRRAIERQGGRIWIEGSPSGGTTVAFRLPRTPP